MNIRFLAAIALVAATVLPAFATTWLNETNLPGEADSAVLSFPSSSFVSYGSTTEFIYGRLYEAGITEAAGAPVGWSAQIGYGPTGTDPLVDPRWVWAAATYSGQVGNEDEFRAQFSPLWGGTIQYTLRFSSDNFATATAADTDGAGSNAGLTFSPGQLGSLTVDGGPAQPTIPEPSSFLLLLLVAGAVVLGLARHWPAVVGAAPSVAMSRA